MQPPAEIQYFTVPVTRSSCDVRRHPGRWNWIEYKASIFKQTEFTCNFYCQTNFWSSESVNRRTSLPSDSKKELKVYLIILHDLILLWYSFFFFDNLMHKSFVLMYLLYSSTCFEHYYSHLQEDSCISTTSGIVTHFRWLFNTQVTRGLVQCTGYERTRSVYRLREDSFSAQVTWGLVQNTGYERIRSVQRLREDSFSAQVTRGLFQYTG